VSYVQRQDGDKLFLALPRFVEFVRGEPRIAAVLDNFESEYKAECLKFEQTDDELVTKFEKFWRRHKSWFVGAWDAMFEAGKDTPVMHKFGHPRDIPEYLQSKRRKADHGVSFGIESSRLSDVFSRMDAMWFSCVAKDPTSELEQSKLFEFRRGYSEIAGQADFARRRREVVEHTHPGASWRRLSWAADNICPSDDSKPIGSSEDDEEQIVAASIEGLELSNAALCRNPLVLSGFNREPRRSILHDDLEILREETVRRMGIHLSHRALVMRFKAKCERFLSTELRAKCLKMGRKAEDILTLVAAEYMFEQGLNPLFNAQIVTLRPDLFDGSMPHALYVEAKQYGGAGRLPTNLIKKAAWQVWDTWNELDAQHRVTEAFLLVFRRGGPLIVFEGPARIQGRTLHPVLVDISPTDLKGSRANKGPIAIAVSDLLPAAQQKLELKMTMHRRRKARA
jgi:hypothetical protein